MNKRYLYRAKAIDTGDLVFGSLVYSPKEDEYYIVEHNGEELSWLVDENTIEQCTGYEDDEGYLIFENDEVIYYYYSHKSKGKVICKEGCFGFEDELKVFTELRHANMFSIKLINPTYIE